ncbi:XRE family transcriptional regulator [Candidatus Pantoea deserta]|uniref:XRE family transcriptional regulator n=1 Tax=Candidatus Pantoea deserta TaxID=1869313 RepID=A0A3N4P8R9_9GAMM|nr:helix-turn-helix transcriptional regulator [Pantoea deserta]RPE04666.1 XRE family transcriptional regulator [Pantoea deserta]
MNIQEQIAKKLVEARVEAGLSAVAVADAIGVVRQTYGKFEQAQSGWAYEETVLRLKNIYRVSFVCMLDRLSKCRLISQKNSAWLWAIVQREGWNKYEPSPITEALSYKSRLKVLSRKAWEAGAASESFLSDLLELNRQELSVLLNKWYAEQEAGQDAISMPQVRN